MRPVLKKCGGHGVAPSQKLYFWGREMGLPPTAASEGSLVWGVGMSSMSPLFGCLGENLKHFSLSTRKIEGKKRKVWSCYHASGNGGSCNSGSIFEDHSSKSACNKRVKAASV